MKEKSTKITSLDSLRFAMVFVIVIAHLDFWGTPENPNFFNLYLQNAAVAVDFFFILSGFGLSVSTRRDPSRLPSRCTPGALLGYAAARIRKLYKLYLITMLCAIPVSLLEKVYRGQDIIPATAKTAVEIIISPTLLQSASGFLAISHCLNGVAWFLSCLFILYILYPLLEKLNQKIIYFDFVIPALIITFALSCLVHSGLYRIETTLSPGNLTLDLSHSSPYMRVFHLFCGMLLGDIYAAREGIGGEKAEKKSADAKSEDIGADVQDEALRKLLENPQKNTVRHPRGYITGTKATLLESAALALAFLTTIFGNAVARGQLTEIKNALYLLSAMLTVYIFAICRGKLSHVLTKETPVFLGSLAMYIFLIHYVIRQTIGIIVFEYLDHTPVLDTAVTVAILLLTMIFTFVAAFKNFRE